MRIFDADVSYSALQFLKGLSFENMEFESANKSVEEVCGCKEFFPTEDSYYFFQNEIDNNNHLYFDEQRSEYGDYQTNERLTNAVTSLLLAKNVMPEVVIEPTCGKGNFIVSALISFPSIKHVIGIEIHEPYVWQCKFNILDYFIKHPDAHKPIIQIFHYNVFDFDFVGLKRQIINKNLLILGNPPWVTNSMLGGLNSTNLPQKSNFKKHKGIDAITGKGNFDIAEYIVLSLLSLFEKHDGYMSLLLKNSVIRNIIYEQRNNRFGISDIEELNIDSKKEFNVSADASLLLCRFNAQPSLQCQVSDFYSGSCRERFGWIGNSFCSKIGEIDTATIDGKCQFEWRQGIKHDCSRVMELERVGNKFCNKLHETFDIEDYLVYGLLKSSDLKSVIAPKPTKYTIITQKSIGQDTSYIAQYPQTYDYLQKHIEFFRNRKSSVYKGKPDFSIFGIGDYSFKPYKVAISGLYKTFHFTLVKSEDKAIMLDDTCYFVGFDELKNAVIVLTLLNSDVVTSFLKSITFIDAKRMITKDVLRRIDLLKTIKEIDIDKAVIKANDMMKFCDCNAILTKEDFYNLLSQDKMQLELF